MHNPSQAAHVVVPQAPLGHVANGTNNTIPGMGMKALLAKKMAKSNNPKFVSPTDNLMTPVTQKLNAAKQKHFTKGAKPMGALFPTKESHSSEQEDHSQSDTEPTKDTPSEVLMEEDENPF
jgi:carbamate kinase